MNWRKTWTGLLAAALALSLAACSGSPAASSQPPDGSGSAQSGQSAGQSAGQNGEIQPYGTRVEVDGGFMNVLVVGEGETSIVWLPGFTDPAPGLSYAKMLEELSPNYTVYVVEPFGYGLSDVTDQPRTMENITSEVHQAVQQLGARRYVLMAHSISGIYAMEYLNDYRDEVIAYVGLDTSTPKMRDEIAMDVELGELTDVNIPQVSDEINRQYQLIADRVSLNANWVDENQRMTENFEQSKAYSIPAGLPTAFYLSQESVDSQAMLPIEQNDWVAMHRELIPEGTYSQIEVLDAGHLLYQTHYAQLTQLLTDFLAGMP